MLQPAAALGAELGLLGLGGGHGGAWGPLGPDGLHRGRTGGYLLVFGGLHDLFNGLAMASGQEVTGHTLLADGWRDSGYP